MKLFQLRNGAQDGLARFRSKSVPLLVKSSATVKSQTENSVIDFVHDVAAEMAAAAKTLNEVLSEVVEFLSDLVCCDACFMYVVEDGRWVLKSEKRSSSEALDEPRFYMGDALLRLLRKHRMPITISDDGPEDPEFISLDDLGDRSGESLVVIPLLSRNDVLGVITVQHQKPYVYSEREMKTLSAIGFLLGSEIMRTQLEAENARLIDRLETRKLLERGKGILQRELGVTEEQAYLALQRQSRQKRRPIKEIAQAIILRDQVKPE